jgi:hypothetical protein
MFRDVVLISEVHPFVQRKFKGGYTVQIEKTTKYLIFFFIQLPKT